MLNWGPFVLIVVPTVALGVLAGRFPRLLVLVVLPVPIAWIWYRRNYGGPDDDITGLAATFFALLDMAIFLAAAAVAWLALRAWRRTRANPTA
jgi:hypothetical protein